MSYVQQAIARARRRRSPWNLLLIPAVVAPLGLLWWGVVELGQLLHAEQYPGQDLSTATAGLGPVLTTLSPFLAALPLSLLVGNALVRAVGPARRALDQEASAFPDTTFANAQRRLLRASVVLVPIGMALAALGAFLPW